VSAVYTREREKGSENLGGVASLRAVAETRVSWINDTPGSQRQLVLIQQERAVPKSKG